MDEHGACPRIDLAAGEAGVARFGQDADGRDGQDAAVVETRESAAGFKGDGGDVVGGEGFVRALGQVRRGGEHVVDGAERLIGPKKTETRASGVGQEAGAGAGRGGVADHVGAGGDVSETGNVSAAAEGDGTGEHIGDAIAWRRAEGTTADEVGPTAAKGGNAGEVQDGGTRAGDEGDDTAAVG